MSTTSFTVADAEVRVPRPTPPLNRPVGIFNPYLIPNFYQNCMFTESKFRTLLPRSPLIHPPSSVPPPFHQKFLIPPLVNFFLKDELRIFHPSGMSMTERSFHCKSCPIIRYVRDAACGIVFERHNNKGLANGVTEMTLTPLMYHSDKNETSVQAMGWIGERGRVSSRFFVLILSYFSFCPGFFILLLIFVL